MSDPSRPPSTEAAATTVELVVDGTAVEVDGAGTLLDALRDQLGHRSVKDGCSPQGQCGCCTVLVDGAPRVACVTPVRRVRGRAITTVDGLDDADQWAEAFCATGASQCGFCTPGIMVRLAGLAAKRPELGVGDHDAVEQALLAHLCRCTGWRTILDAWDERVGGRSASGAVPRDLEAAARRASLEGGATQSVTAAVARGAGGFSDDTAPEGALVAVLSPAGDWTLGESVAAARALAGKVQGRRTTVDATPPVAPPEGDWVRTLQTSWVEPGYLEPDASWAAPGTAPADPLANGGAFGGKETTDVASVAQRLAGDAAAPVRALYSREDVVRRGPKRPPLAAGIAADGSVAIRVAATAGVGDALRAGFAAAGGDPDRCTIEEVRVAGPATARNIRAAGWAEGAVLALAAPAVTGRDTPDPGADVASGADSSTGWIGPVRPAGGGAAWARVDDDGIAVRVDAGAVLDEVTLRSYCIGAAHQAASWVASEALTVDDDGDIHDLTIRSFGILRAVDTPPITVTIDPTATDAPPVAVSDAVFAAVAAAVWLAQGTPPVWPTGQPLR